MMLFLECKPDETLAVALGVPKRNVIHNDGKGEVCKALCKRQSVTGMVDEDPLSAQPPYLKTLVEKESNGGIKLLVDAQRQNRLIVVCPYFEDWLVKTVKDSDLSLAEFGFTGSDGKGIHSEINQRIGSLQRLLAALLASNNQRMLRLKSLLNA